MNIILRLPLLWGMILCLITIALVCLLLPLYKSPKAKNKTFFLAAFIPVWVGAVGFFYWQWGGALALQDATSLTVLSATLEKATTDPNTSSDEMLATFEKLENDLDYSALALAQLGSIYNQLGLFDRSIAIYERAIKLNTDPEYKVQWIYSHSLKHQGKLPNVVRDEAEKIIKTYPEQKSLINLLAIDDYFQGHFEEAIKGWVHLLTVDQELSAAQRQTMENAIAKAKLQSGISHVPTQIDEIFFKVKVSLSPSLTALVAEDDTVFVFIKSKEENQPPLAVMRKRASELPFEIDLGNKQSMMGGITLKTGLEVKVVAKISKSGNPLEKKSELRGISPSIVIKSGAHPVELVINECIG